jgi:hypothetical protein
MRYLPPPIPDPAPATLDSRHGDVEAEVRSEPAGDAANGRHPLRRDSARIRARLLTVLLAKLKAAR